MYRKFSEPLLARNYLMTKKSTLEPSTPQKRSHPGLKIAKVLFPLLLAAFSAAVAIQGAILHIRVVSCLLLIVGALLFTAAAWLFISAEMGLYYDREARRIKVDLAISAEALHKKNIRGWISLGIGVVLIVVATVLGNNAPLMILYAFLIA